MTTTYMRAALRYAAKGVPVFPLAPATKVPTKGSHGYLDASRSEAVVQVFWEDEPRANVGMPTGARSGYIIIDEDPRNGGDVSPLHLPPTLTARTPSGGCHYYLKHPGEGFKVPCDTTGKLGPGIDVKGDGGYAVLPPSSVEGRAYAWVDLAIPAADIPPQLWPLLVARAEPERHNGVHPLPADDAALIADGQRNTTLTSLAGSMRRRGITAPEIEAALLAVNAARCLPPLPERDVERIAASMSRYPAGVPGEVQQGVKSERSVISPPGDGRLSTLSTLLTPVPTYPAELDAEAYHGLAGDIVSLLAPETEADPVALLGQLLAAFGNASGRHAYFRVGADLHYPNLFLTLVGPTSGGRKGLSFGLARQRIAEVAQEWADDRITNGLASGEGLIHHVRDADPPHDPGVTDKRLLVHEPEFASVLKVATREGNTLSAIVRKAWDGHSLHNLTKTAGAKATTPHISIIGHITKEELNRYLTTTEAGNGFGNRFLWLCVRRSQFLPDGGDMQRLAPALAKLDVKVREALDFASEHRELRRDEEAKVLWHQEYRGLAEGHPGLLGAITNRAEAQVMRLALLYALLDKAEKITIAHLKAGLAVWRYADASAAYVFGTALGDPLADAVLQKIRASGDEGVAQTDLTLDHGRHGATGLNRALGWLQELRLIESVSRQTGGRPATFWKAIRDSVKSERSVERRSA
jgi:hypothetical protein